MQLGQGHVQLLLGLQGGEAQETGGRENAEAIGRGECLAGQKDGGALESEGQGLRAKEGERRDGAEEGATGEGADPDSDSAEKRREADLSAGGRGRAVEGHYSRNPGGLVQSDWESVPGCCHSVLLWPIYGHFPLEND